jgi:hypothetical protein
MAARRDWLLLGPWYRWASPGVPAAGRASRPAIEKFASARFMEQFLAEPQRSLKYDAEDQVYTVVGGALRQGRAGAWVGTGVRKLFLPTHQRFYLVVCELHCDAPGLPGVARGEVAEAGFVVRRRVPRVPPQVRLDLERVAGRMAQVQTRLAAASGPDDFAAGGLGQRVQQALAGVRAQRRAALEEELGDLERQLSRVVAAGGLGLTLQGWFPGEDPDQGAWRAVAPAPDALAGERTYPLYPLVPDPAEHRHTAAGRTLYFGVVPTGDRAQDATGAPHLDDRQVYELRCFVRRPRPGCPPEAGKGELVWSRASEPYRLAAHHDLDGTAHRPVTVQMPDLPALAAQVAGQPAGRGAGVRMVTPADSQLQFDVDDDGNAANAGLGGAQICFFAIPLITIVATFVLRLFLPIVVFTFGLWFLLKLRFCIPPSFSLDAGLAASLDVDGDFGLDVDLSVDATLALEVGGALAANLGAGAGDALGGSKGLTANEQGQLALDLSPDYSAAAPPDLAAEFDPPPAGSASPAAELRLGDAALEYHERLEPPT